jgi:hypothetical protein
VSPKHEMKSCGHGVVWTGMVRRGHDGWIVSFDVRAWGESVFGSPGPSEWDCES